MNGGNRKAPFLETAKTLTAGEGTFVSEAPPAVSVS